MKHWVRILAVLLVLCLTLAACSSGSNDTQPEPALELAPESAAEEVPADSAVEEPATEAVVIESAEVSREDDTLTLTWTASADGTADVLWYTPEGTPDEGNVLVEGATSPLDVEDPASGRRVFYQLETGDQSVTVAERMVPVASSPNLRDIGGYQTKDGKSVRWGMVYRSGKMVTQDPEEIAVLESLGLGKNFDLRDVEKAKQEPDPDLAGVEYISVSGVNRVDIDGEVSNENMDQHGPDIAYMMELYNEIPANFSGSFREILDHLTSDDPSPILYHCSSGKDRTGMMTAIILRMLEVDEAVIRQDYLLSNDNLAEGNAQAFAYYGDVLTEENLQKFQYMLGVDERMYDAFFAKVEEDYGSFEQYVEEELGMTPEKIQKLKDNLLV